MNQTQVVSSPLKMSVKVMAIISIVANIFFSLVFLPVFIQIWGFSNGEKLVLESGAYSKEVVLVGILFLLLTCVFGAFGAFKMFKAKRIGFYIYVVSNSMWVAFGLFLGSSDAKTLVYVLSSIAFIVFFVMNRKVFI